MSAPEPGSETDSGQGKITHWRGYTLSLFQIQAIEAIRGGANVFVAAPTGAGKTLVAEYAIADAVARGRRCVYTAPIKALSNQKYRDFRDDPNVDVGLMTGDVTISPRAQVLIMTTEILRNAIFEDPAGLADVDYVIFDEVHFLDDLERGTVWEEALIFCPPTVRFLCLSATVANVDQVGSWLREIRPQDQVVVESHDRPVPLRHRLRTVHQRPFPLERLAWVKKEELRHAARGGKGGKGGKRGRGGRERPGFGLRPGDLRRLFDELQEDRLLPALVFSFSRRDCERLAAQNSRRQLLDPAEQERMAGLQADLLELFQLDDGELRGEVFQLAMRGVGYHHAGMLPIHKEIVERLFTSGLMRLLFTTETFALGINMPARTVVFTGLRKFDGVSFDYMRTRDYLQMAGRAGRLGLDSEGLVISHLDEKALAEAPLERLLQGRPEAVMSRFKLSYSSILHLYEALGRERVYEAWEKSFNSYQHRAKSRKARERNQQQQRRLVDAHLDLLADLHYLDPEGGLMARGRIAKLLYGYELPLTELLFDGVLERFGALELAVVVVALVHEERGRGPQDYVPPKLFREVRGQVDSVSRELLEDERHFGLDTGLRLPCWGLTVAVKAWVEGASFEDLEGLTQASGGELVRTFRMTLQLVRQLRRSLEREDPLRDTLEEVIQALNRDEVDARRQLELG